MESLAKLVDRLNVYNNEFEDYDDLDDIVCAFREQINLEQSQGTKEIPVERFKQETEHLLTLPNQDILKSYVASPKEYKVSKESMITYKGQKYSVPTYLIDKSVSVKETDQYLNIYYTTNFVTRHKKQNKYLNYHKEHVKEILKSDVLKGVNDDIIEDSANKYLAVYDKL